MIRSWCLVGILASGCSVIGSNGPGLNKQCDRTLPAIDTALALTAGAVVLALAASDADTSPELIATGAVFGGSAVFGFSKARQCRERPASVPVLLTSVRDEFLGARQWRTTMWVLPKESPLVALERAYQRAALICEGRGLSALDATRMAPRRPTQIALTYKCH